MDLSQMKAAFKTVITELGVPAVHEAAAPPNTRTTVDKLGFKTVSKDDQVIVNSLGVDAKVITVDKSDVAVIKKFDSFEIGSETYVAHSVHPIHLGAEVIGFKVFAKGA